jgi:hypothetical protein
MATFMAPLAGVAAPCVEAPAELELELELELLPQPAMASAAAPAIAARGARDVRTSLLLFD